MWGVVNLLEGYGSDNPGSKSQGCLLYTSYIVRVHFSQTAKETMEDKIKRLLREEVRKM